MTLPVWRDISQDIAIFGYFWSYSFIFLVVKAIDMLTLGFHGTYNPIRIYELHLKQFRPLPSSKSKWVWDPDNTTALKLSILEGRHGSQRKDRKCPMVETLWLNNLVTMCTAKIRKEEIVCPFCQDFIQVLSTPWSLPSSPEVVGG